MKIILNKFGTVLVSRPSGKEAYMAFQPTLKGIKANETIEIDFDDVLVLTPSWADEFITPLKKQFNGRVTLLETDNPSVKATLHTLEQARLAAK